MSYNAYVTRIKNIRMHTNADRLNVGECFGNPVVIGLDIEEGQIGVYFPTDGKLGLEFAEENNLLRKKDELGNNIGGYLDPIKRKVETIRLRGEKSDGLFMPIECLSKFCDINELKEGTPITILNGILICEKYIPQRPNRIVNPTDKKSKKNRFNQYPLFAEHVHTSQLAYNMNAFKEGDLCSITLKMHGSSARTSRMLKNNKPNLIDKLLRKIGIGITRGDWDYISGTRRVVLDSMDSYKGGFYGSNMFRKDWHEHFKGKLKKNETVYYEIVGYTDTGSLIMPSCSNKKTKDKEFIKQYGDTTEFTYGCEKGQSDIYVYRMTMTNEDGVITEYSTSYTKLRCEQMGVKHVPVLDKFIFTNVDDLKERVDKYVDGVDPIGKTHVREGIVVRIEDREKFTAYKHKNFSFKVLENIIKLDDVLDMEEAQSVQED